MKTQIANIRRNKKPALALTGLVLLSSLRFLQSQMITPLPTLGGSMGSALALNGSVTMDGNLVNRAIPEPSTVALFVLGFGLFAWRRRVNRAA